MAMKELLGDAMATGMQINDATGLTIVDYTTAIWNVYGSFYTAGTNGVYSNPMIKANTTKVIIAAADIQTREAEGSTLNSPEIHVVDGAINWSIKTDGKYWIRWLILFGEG